MDGYFLVKIKFSLVSFRKWLIKLYDCRFINFLYFGTTLSTNFFSNSFHRQLSLASTTSGESQIDYYEDVRHGWVSKPGAELEFAS